MKPKSLYRELTIAMVVLVSFVSIAVTALNYLYLAREAEASYQSKSAEYAVYLREALEWPLWNVDDELITKVGSAFASNAEIATLIIRDDQQRVVYQQQKPNGKQVTHVVAIEHNGQNIGNVEIGLTLSIYEERDRQLLLVSTMTMVLLIAVLLGATRWLLSRMLRTPINAFIAATNDMVDGKYKQINLPETYAEFALILSGFKTMSDAVASRENSLRQSNAQLEAEVVERKRAEEALRVSEERWQFALEGAGDGVWDWDVQNNQTIFSKRWKEIVGYAEDEFENSFEAWRQHIHPDDVEPTMAALQNYFDGKAMVYRVEFRMRCKDGGWKWILARGKVVGRDAKGRPLRMIGTHADISERKQAEEQLWRSEHGLAEAQRIAHLGNWELDLSSNDLIWSDEIYRIFEIDKEKFGASYDAFLNAIHPDDREMVSNAYSESLKSKVPYDIEHRLLMQDGRIKYVNEKCETHYDKDGKPLRSVGTVHDITERKQVEFVLRQSEEGLKEAQRIAHLGSWHLDLATNQVFWSEELYRMYGFDPALPPPLYTESMKLFTPESWERLSAAIARATETGIPYELELETVHKDGGRGWMLARGELVRDAYGAAVRVRGVVMDITERKTAEEELRRYKDHLEDEVQQRTADLVLARNAAEAANQAKSVFLSSMSHELRTPLNAILGFSNMMRKDPQLEAQRGNLDIINRSGEHLLTLINDVLEMAKIEAGRVQLESAPFDLGGLVRDVTDMMQIRAQEKGLQLLVDQSSEFPRYIKGDEARLRQVLINLVGNAVKFTQQGGVTIRFGVKPRTTPPRLLVEVEDSGPGIKPEDQQKIFEPFVQLGQADAQKGTGLGLTITRQFVQLMGGTISVESIPGKGSTFRVELPVHKVAAADVLKPESAVRGEVVSLAPHQPEFRILIVEDQLENQLLLSKLMESVGFQVKVADNGEQGVQLFLSWHPHLIWMDRRMPVMDGLEATRRIRELPGGKEVKIVAVTASAFLEQRDEIFKAGMDDFVRKPYRFNEIYECLTKQLGVQYTYAEAQEGVEASDVVLTPEMLAVLPPDLRHELHDAVESLEGERIFAVIQQAASYDATLCKTLSHLADNFDYPAILKALQANN